jgi:hypothetical protein
MSPIFVPPASEPSLPATALTQVVLSDLGAVAELTTEDEILGWINRGCARLPARAEHQVAITWAAGDSAVTLPSDFVRFNRLEVRDGFFGAYNVWGQELSLLDPLTTDGNGVVYYYGHFGPVGLTPPSGLPILGDEAVIAYAKYCFFQKIASSRSDFRRYCTITGQNGIEVTDLVDLAERMRQDYVDAAEQLDDLEGGEPATWFGD